jgi:hypothetical protein
MALNWHAPCFFNVVLLSSIFPEGRMAQSKMFRYGSNTGFGSSAVQGSSFKTWATYALRSYAQSNGSEDSAPVRKVKEIDPDPRINQKSCAELLKRREELQQLIKRAYTDLVARRVNQ